MIAVPDATLFASDPRPMRRSNSAIISGGKSVRERRERTIEHEPGDLPVAGHRVLARRALRHPAECAARPVAAEPPRSTTRSRPRLRSVGSRSGIWRVDVADRIAALVAVDGGVRQFADAGAVHDDQDDAIWRSVGQGTEPASSERAVAEARQ